MNTLLSNACVVNNRGYSNLIDLEDACVVERAAQSLNRGLGRAAPVVATFKAAKPNGAQHEQYSGDIHLVD